MKGKKVSPAPQRRHEAARKAISRSIRRKTIGRDSAAVPLFAPVDIPGVSLSETVIRERR